MHAYHGLELCCVASYADQVLAALNDASNQDQDGILFLRKAPPVGPEWSEQSRVVLKQLQSENDQPGMPTSGRCFANPTTLASYSKRHDRRGTEATDIIVVATTFLAGIC